MALLYIVAFKIYKFEKWNIYLDFVNTLNIQFGRFSLYGKWFSNTSKVFHEADDLENHSSYTGDVLFN